MTTKTIPEYLEDERRKNADTQLRTEKEAARIQALHHGHHRTPTPRPELPAPVEAVVKARKTTVAKARKAVATKTAAGKKPAAKRQTGTKTRKRA